MENSISTFRVDQASYNTDSKTNEVSEGILVVSPDDHASVGDDDVLQAADDGGGEGRVVAGAEDNGEHQDEAKHAGEQELRHKYRVMPSFKLLKYFDLLLFLNSEVSPIILDKSSVMKKTMIAGRTIKRQL